MVDNWDVVVVGAGPAGATTAMLLARRGYRVLIVDRQHFPRPKACAEYLSPGVRVVLRRLGLEDVALVGAELVPGMDITSPSGRTLRVTYSQNGKTETAATVPRTVLDDRLLQAACAAGATLFEGFIARGARWRDGVVVGVTGTQDGMTVEIAARLTIVADGNRSAMARSLLLACAARWPLRMGLVAHMDRVNMPEGFGQMHVTRQGYCGIAPLPGGTANVAMVVPLKSVSRSGTPASAFFQAWLRSRSSLQSVLHDSQLISPIRGVAPIGSRAKRSWTPGALLVGDAAGFFDPFTGEGIYRALRGAELASGVADSALNAGDLTSGLSGYETLRRNEFRSKSAVTALVQLFVQRPALLEYAVPRLHARPVPLQILGNVLGDLEDPAHFLQLGMLWSALRP